MSIGAQSQLTVCYLSQQTHAHINGCCTLIRPFMDSRLVPLHFDEEADDA